MADEFGAGRCRDPDVHLLSWPEADTPAPLRRQILALQHQVWPGDDSSDALTHDPQLKPVTFALVDVDKVIATLDVLTKSIVHHGRVYRASGLSAVVVAPAHRGRGLGRTLVVAAGTAMRATGADLALFTCDRPLQWFYEGAGFELLPGTVLVGGTPQRPFASDRPGFDKVTMAAFYSADARTHRDRFVHCRIALHPGEIDRLW